MFTQQKQVSTVTFAPDNSGFTHSKSSQFLHFQGKGVRKTFGLSAEELGALFKAVNQQLQNQLHDQTLCMRLNITSGFLTDNTPSNCPDKHKSDSELATAAVNSGHIPIILEAIAPAEAHMIAARKISPNDTADYFSRMPGAKAQAREYVFKQEGMAAIADLRAEVVALRYQAKERNNHAQFMECNLVIATLDNEVIKKNQESLPSEYEQFDLCSTFFDTVHGHICQLDQQREGALIQKLINKLNACTVMHVNTVVAQRQLSKALYDDLDQYVTELLHVDKDAKELYLTAAQNACLQAILPLLAYLNSSNNPFARNGLKGKEISNDFHREAIKAYEDHESKEIFYHGQFSYVDKRDPSQVRSFNFTDDQINQLLYGKVDPDANKPKPGLFGRISNAVSGLLTDGTRSGSTNNSQSFRKRKQQALIMPAEYQLMITAGPVDSPKPVATSAATSSTSTAARSSGSRPDKALGSPFLSPRSRK